jgi:flagellar protein FlbD
MIRVHRFDGSQLVINAELIETVEATPDTVIHLTTGKVYVVRDTVEQILSRCLQYKRAVFEGLVGHPMGILPSRWTDAPDDVPAAEAADEQAR